MIISTAALAANIRTTSDKLGVRLPTGFTAALTAARELPNTAGALAGCIPQLHAAALNALAAGKDPADDKDVQKFIVHTALAGSGLQQAAGQRANADLRDAINEFADDIIGVWADALRDDLAVLQSAVTELHLADLTAADHTQLRQRGQLNLWADAANAADRADAAMSGYHAILSAIAVNSNASNRPLMLAPDIGLPEFSSLTGKSTAWTVARTGTPLRLASIGEYTGAVGRIMAERGALERKVEAEQEQAKRASRGPMPLPRRADAPPMPERIG
ncbi:MAG: hypothetical protein ACOYB7_14350 [Mycobacterium sp.]